MSQAPSHSFLDEDSFFNEMLCSQSDLEERMVSLKEVMGSERPVEDKLNELLDFLSSSSIKSATVDILDEKVFSTALVSARRMHSEVLKSIEATLRNKPDRCVDEVRQQLSVLLDLLKCWDLCIARVKALQKVSIMEVKSFPESFFQVMLGSMRHCKASAQHYGDYFQAVSDVLTSLFRHCVGTLASFYALLDAVICFDTGDDEQLSMLLRIVDETGAIATIASGTDAKVLTDMWKRFGKLSTIHCSDMKRVSPSTVTHHFKGLAESIVVVLSAVDRNNQRAQNERQVMCCRLLLKILEKLSDTYCGWIRNDAMLGLVVLLAHLMRYTEQCLRLTTGFSSDLVKFITTNLSSMFEPFLDVVFKSDTFKSAYFEHAKSEEVEASGYHLLTLLVCKKLSSLPYDTQREWNCADRSIVGVCLGNVDRLTGEICQGKLQVQVSRDVVKSSYVAGIYEATCLNVFALVCHVRSEDFGELVNLLLKHLLGGQFYGALLSADVWCFVCRLGSSEVCYSHFKYLAQVYDLLAERKSNVNVIVLANLLGRQYTLLADKDKIDFVNGLHKASDLGRWKSIVRAMDERKREMTQQMSEAAQVNSRVAKHLKSLEEHPSLTALNALIEDLSIMEAGNVPQGEQSADTFVKMWSKTADMLGDCEGTVLLLLEELATSLLCATRPQLDQSKYMTSVLESMAALYPYASSRLRLQICAFFKRCAAQLTENDSSIVAELFCRLLSDNDPIVQQQAFESFEHLTRSCPNADLLSSVALTIRNNQSELSRTLPAYISGETIHELVGFASSEEFFQCLCGSEDKKHVCYERSLADRKEKCQKLNGEEPISTVELEDAERCVERVCNDMEVIVKFKGHLKKDSCDRLRQTCQKFLDKVC